MLERSIFRHCFPAVVLIAASAVLTAFLVSCGREQAEHGRDQESAAPVEKNAVSVPETGSSANAAPESSPSANAGTATETETWEGFVYPHEDRSGAEPVIYAERVYYDGKPEPDTEKVVYLRAPANAVDVVIPDGVTEIAPDVFNECPSLESLVFPDSVKSLPHSMVSLCMKLRSVVLPSGIAAIPDGVFFGCRELKEIAIPEGVETIGVGAFVGCQKLERVSLPESLKSIGRGAFTNCRALKEIAIPESVKEIGENAFRECPCEESVRRLKESRGIVTPPPPQPEER